MKRSDIRLQARAITELEVGDVGDDVLNALIREGYLRMIAVERRWPFFEATSTLNVSVGVNEYTTGTYDVYKEIVSVSDLSGNGQRLSQIAPETAEDMFITQPGQHDAANPWYWSKWDDILQIWPTPTQAVQLRLRGYRHHIAWYDGDTIEVDAHFSLHQPLVYYAVARLYQLQEDVDLASFWMQTFEESVQMARRDLMRPPSARPMQMNYGPAGRVGPSPYRLSWWNR